MFQKSYIIMNLHLFSRYAFSPLLDAADDEDEDDETVMNDAFGKIYLPSSQMPSKFNYFILNH